MVIFPLYSRAHLGTVRFLTKWYVDCIARTRHDLHPCIVEVSRSPILDSIREDLFDLP
jgi:hypothetical protein